MARYNKVLNPGSLSGSAAVMSTDDMVVPAPDKLMTSIGVPVVLRERLAKLKIIPRESWHSVIERAVTELEAHQK